MKIWIDIYKNSFLNFLFPSICLHCHAPLQQNLRLLCSDCLESLAFSIPALYCRRCFDELNHPDNLLCDRCVVYPLAFKRTYALFERSSQLNALKNHLKNRHSDLLIKGIAGFMVYYYLQQTNELPDFVLSEGELAKEIGTMLNISHLKIKKSIFHDHILNSPEQIEDRSILLVSLELDQNVKCLAETLLEHYPSKITGLCFIH